MPDAGMSSMASGGITAGVGAILDIAGTAINANEAGARRKLYEQIANTPGLDFEAIASQALSGYEGLLPRSQALSGKLSSANQAQLLAQEEQALPGLGAIRAKALQRIGGLFDDDAEWLRGVQRRGAALGLSSGLRGSQAGALQTLRLSDREQAQRTQLGTGLLGSLISNMHLANTPGVQAFLGPSMSEQLNQRAAERTQKMNILLGRADLPTGMEVWGTRLQQVGGTMEGVGSQELVGGSGPRAKKAPDDDLGWGLPAGTSVGPGSYSTGGYGVYSSPSTGFDYSPSYGFNSGGMLA